MKKSYNLKYNKTKKCENLIFGDDLKFWSFLKMKHWIYKKSPHFLKIHIYSIVTNKMWCVEKHLNIFKNELQNISLKNSFLFFKKFRVFYFFLVIPLAPNYRFWPSH